MIIKPTWENVELLFHREGNRWICRKCGWNTGPIEGEKKARDAGSGYILHEVSYRIPGEHNCPNQIKAELLEATDKVMKEHHDLMKKLADERIIKESDWNPFLDKNGDPIPGAYVSNKKEFIEAHAHFDRPSNEEPVFAVVDGANGAAVHNSSDEIGSIAFRDSDGNEIPNIKAACRWCEHEYEIPPAVAGWITPDAPCPSCNAMQNPSIRATSQDGSPSVSFYYNPDNSLFIEFEHADGKTARFVLSEKTLLETGALKTSDVPLRGRK